MAHYALLDDGNIVVRVITGIDETQRQNLPEGYDSWEQWYGDFTGMKCKRTSYNTIAGTHMRGGTPFRKNYAGIGYKYDERRDAFIPPKPFDSWLLDSETCQWFPPVEMPDDGQMYTWDEETTNWVLVEETA